MTKLKKIKVLLTASNSLVSPGIIADLRKIRERSIKIIGVDVRTLGAGSRFVDKFYRVPLSNFPNYVSTIFKICKEDRVTVLVPASDEEVFVLSQEKKKFRKIGTTIAVNDYQVILKAGDKGSFLTFLKNNNLPCTQFRIPKNLREFRDFCYQLGYPKKPVVIKPRKSRGNRGFRIIQKEVKKGDLWLKHKPGVPILTFNDMIAILTSKEIVNFPEVILMEYLPGREYSVDILVKNGKALIVVPKLRIIPVPGLSIAGQVDLNPEVIQLVKDICRAFRFNYNVNLQFKYSKDGILYPYEANTRIAASIAACRAAGANLVYYGIKLALNEPIPKVRIKDGMKMIRYYKEYYEYE